MYLKRYVRGLEQIQLKKLVKFITGSDLINVNAISVSFIKPETALSFVVQLRTLVDHVWSYHQLTAISVSSGKNFQIFYINHHVATCN